MAENNEELVEELIDRGALRTHRIIEAFRAVDRKRFLPAEHRDQAYEDRPLPIGRGQTNSQPTTVAFMLELLSPLAGERVLDIGAGSAWTTALLSHIVGPEGEVVATEKERDLVTFARTNLETNDFGDAVLYEALDVLGWPDGAPYNRILVSASAAEFPEELLDQLLNGGDLVMPVGDAIWHVTKRAEGDVRIERHEGFSFVPLR